MNLLFLTLLSIPTIFLVLTLILSLSLILKQRKVKKAANLPPDHPKLPIIGNLHQIGNTNHHSPWNLSKNYIPTMLLQLVFVHCIMIQDCVHKYEIIVLLNEMKFDELTLNLAPSSHSNPGSILVSIFSSWLISSFETTIHWVRYFHMNCPHTTFNLLDISHFHVTRPQINHQTIRNNNLEVWTGTCGGYWKSKNEKPR